MKYTNTLVRATLVLTLIVPQVSFVFAQTLPADTSTPPMQEMAPEMPAGPSISNVTVTDITDTSARIEINSDEVVQGYVEYGTTEQYGMSTPLSSEFSTSPSFLLENLTPETLYHYRVIAMDSAGNVAITSDETFTTLATPTPEPEAPPASEPATSTTTTTTPSTSPSPVLAISNTETASVSTSSARITWQTNNSADSQVEYGSTVSYGSLTTVGAVSLSHDVFLSGLISNTKYYYRAISKTSSGESAYGPAEQFSTFVVQAAPTAPVISNVSINSVSTSTATISWNTSKSATSDIQYGTTTSYGFSIGKDSTLKTSHTRTISGLAASTLYHFRITVSDSAGNTALGKDWTFTTSALSSSASPASSVPVVPTTTNNSSDVLSKIAQQASQAAAGAPQGGGGLPVIALPPLLLKVTGLDGQVSFDWRKDRGVKNGTIHTLIVKKQGTSYVRSRIDGEIIYDGPATTFTDTAVENGKEYHYALYSYGAFGRFAAPAHFKVIPQAGEEQVDLSAAEVKEENAPPLSFSRDLSRGKRGDDVTALQSYLAEQGFYPEALITSYFGPLTRKAVIRFQKLNDISPAAGYVGPLTKEALGR